MRALSTVLVLAGGCGTGSGTAATEAQDTGAATGTVTSAGAATSSGSASSTGLPAPAVCNGHAQLCDRPYSQIAFPTTHNSVAALDDGFNELNANQVRGVEAQLADGIRGLLLDVTYDDNGSTALCHGPCALGARPHVEVLAAILAFLEANPGEVVTIIYEDSAEVADIEADYVATGLVDLVYTHDPAAGWPTLGEMVSDGTRLVVTAEQGSPPPPWFNHVWDLAWDTPFSFEAIDQFVCDPNRGSPDNDLFLLNHWISTNAGLPSAADAPAANASDVLLTRAQGCRDEAGQVPNFVAIDFYEQGDLFAVVDVLNGV